MARALLLRALMLHDDRARFLAGLVLRVFLVFLLADAIVRAIDGYANVRAEQLPLRVSLRDVAA